MAGGASRRSQPSLSIGLGFEVGNRGYSSEPRVHSYQSPPPLYRAARQGPTSLILGWAPDQGTWSRDELAIGPTGGDQF